MKNYPNFNEWLQSTEGKKCLQWPISDITYLENRLYWAFIAGQNYTLNPKTGNPKGKQQPQQSESEQP